MCAAEIVCGYSEKTMARMSLSAAERGRAVSQHTADEVTSELGEGRARTVGSTQDGRTS